MVGPIGFTANVLQASSKSPQAELLQEIAATLRTSYDKSNEILCFLRNAWGKDIFEKEVIDNKQELFGFEYDYFVPFKMIWSYNDDIDIKEYILEIIKHLISKKGNKINSGWIIIFEIYSSINELNKTDTKHVNIIDEVFKSLTYITSNHLNETFMSVYFDCYIQCLATIAKKYPCDLYEIIDILNLYLKVPVCPAKPLNNAKDEENNA